MFALYRIRTVADMVTVYAQFMFQCLRKERYFTITTPCTSGNFSDTGVKRVFDVIFFKHLHVSAVKVKLSLCLIKHYAIKTYGEVEV
jgi:hypothetical protein